MKKIDTPEMFTSGLLSFLIGEVFVSSYNDLDNKSKRIWDKERICHHGLFGLFLTLGSLGLIIFSKNQSVKNCAKLGISVGVGLMVSDLYDLDRWFEEGLLFSQLEKGRIILLREA